MEKMSVWISPKLIENSSISVNNTCYTFNNFEEVFLMSLANIIELKSNNKWQAIKDDTIITLQNIKDDIQIKYWILNKDTSIATAFIEMVIKQKDYNKLSDMYSLFKINKDYIYKYIDVYESDNFKYNELRRLYKDGHLILN